MDILDREEKKKTIIEEKTHRGIPLIIHPELDSVA